MDAERDALESQWRANEAQLNRLAARPASTANCLSNLVDVHVSNVRKNLGHEFITTRRGQGYLVRV